MLNTEFCLLNTEMTIHKTVLLNETIDALEIKKGMTIIDATLGGGGHTAKVLEKIGVGGKLIAFDQDQQAIDRFENKLKVSGKENKNLQLIHANFSELKDRLTSLNIFSVDAILADLGISSDQLEDMHRGISFQFDAPLDMRMDVSKGMTAAEILNTYDEKRIQEILEKYGDEKFARQIARNIVAERDKKPFTRTLELVEVIEKSVPAAYKRKKNKSCDKDISSSKDRSESRIRCSCFVFVPSN